MDKFFRKNRSRSLTGYTPAEKYGSLAKNYGWYFWDKLSDLFVEHQRTSSSAFNVSLSVGGGNFGLLTKRASLVSDTLLLSHNWTGQYTELARYKTSGGTPWAHSEFVDVDSEWTDHRFGMRCPNLRELGRWIADSEPLLRAGLVWYLPSYAATEQRGGFVAYTPPEPVKQVTPVDVLVKDHRAIDVSAAGPVKSAVVRPVLELDLPFIDGVSMKTFSQITSAEFDSYRAFRDFLRMRFLDLDTALGSEQSERELAKIGVQIRDQVRLHQTQMSKARTARAVAATGAVVGTVGTALVAVYGPALETAIAALGATGGLWGLVHAMSDSTSRVDDQSPWHYVWVLTEETTKRTVH
ncbi:MAG TPA: hypothetical protein VGD71_30225 [Kribbella sp.]|jgi:hypothetical protein